jgi:hypothetical protein
VRRPEIHARCKRQERAGAWIAIMSYSVSAKPSLRASARSSAVFDRAPLALRAQDVPDPAIPDRPIFIVGPHRSGTTLVYSQLAKHPEVAYFTAADRRVPHLPTVAFWISNFGHEGMPHEAQRLWDMRWSGADDRMDATQAAPEIVAWYRRRVGRSLELRGRTRFLAKYPRLSLRLDWLDAVFPGCLFLHVVRDWRAVVHSTAERREKRHGRGGDAAHFGVRVPGWRAMADLPPAVAAGRIYRHVTRWLEADAERFGPRMRRVSYEDLCARPVEELRAVADWAGLAPSESFERRCPRALTARNDKWRASPHRAEFDRIRAEDPELFARYET